MEQCIKVTLKEKCIVLPLDFFFFETMKPFILFLLTVSVFPLMMAKNQKEKTKEDYTDDSDFVLTEDNSEYDGWKENEKKNDEIVKVLPLDSSGDHSEEVNNAMNAQIFKNEVRKKLGEMIMSRMAGNVEEDSDEFDSDSDEDSEYYEEYSDDLSDDLFAPFPGNSFQLGEEPEQPSVVVVNENIEVGKIEITQVSNSVAGPLLPEGTPIVKSPILDKFSDSEDVTVEELNPMVKPQPKIFPQPTKSLKEVLLSGEDASERLPILAIDPPLLSEDEQKVRENSDRKEKQKEMEKGIIYEKGDKSVQTNKQPGVDQLPLPKPIDHKPISPIDSEEIIVTEKDHDLPPIHKKKKILIVDEDDIIDTNTMGSRRSSILPTWMTHHIDLFDIVIIVATVVMLTYVVRYAIHFCTARRTPPLSLAFSNPPPSHTLSHPESKEVKIPVDEKLCN